LGDDGVAALAGWATTASPLWRVGRRRRRRPGGL